MEYYIFRFFPQTVLRIAFISCQEQQKKKKKKHILQIFIIYEVFL